MSLSAVNAEESIADLDDGADEIIGLENVEEPIDSSDLEDVCETHLETDDDAEVIDVASEERDSDSDVDEENILNIKSKNTLKSSSDDVYGAYVNSLTTYYMSGKYIYFGWGGYFSGYFNIYDSKDSSVVYSEYLSGSNDDRQYCIDDLGAGTYIAALIDDHSGFLDTSYVKIKKATTKITVKSFTVKPGKKVTCRAYVKDKNDGANIDDDYVKFRIAGKTYKAKLRDGVAKITFRAPKKLKAYFCKATYVGDKDIKKSSTKFKMKVKTKVKSKIKLSTFRISSNYYEHGKRLSNGDYIDVYYNTQQGQYGKGLSVMAEGSYPWIGPFYNKLTKVKAFYKNKMTGRVITKTKKMGYYGTYAHFGIKKGYRVYKVKVWHRKLSKNEKRNYRNRFS